MTTPSATCPTCGETIDVIDGKFKEHEKHHDDSLFYYDCPGSGTPATAGGEARQFPLLGGGSIPWAMIEPHEKQALCNHSQTLQRLAKRGGLSPAEAVCVLLDKHWIDKPVKEGSVAILDQLVIEWRETQSPPSPAAPAGDVRDAVPQVLVWTNHGMEPWTPGDHWTRYVRYEQHEAALRRQHAHDAEEIAGLKKEVQNWKSRYETAKSDEDQRLNLRIDRDAALTRVELLEKDKALWDGIETQKAKISYVFYDQETGIWSIYGHDPFSSSGGKSIGSGVTLLAAIASALSASRTGE